MVLKFALVFVSLLLQCCTALRIVRTTTNANHALISSTRLSMFNFGKKKETSPPSPPPAADEGKNEDKSKELVRRALWATTPWIFKDYEDTKNYVDGKKTVKVVVKEKTVDGGLGSYRDRERDRGSYETTGTYNMMDSSRAPVVSGSVQDALFKNKGKAGPSGQAKVEAPKVGLLGNTGMKVAQAVQGGGAGVLADINKYKRPSKTLLLYEYEGSPFCKKVREACSLLDVIVEYRPCPSARYGFSDQLATRTQGDRTVPFFYDPNNSIGGLNSLQDADAIVDYLFDYYGPGAENMPANLKKKVGGNAAAAKFTGTKPITRPQHPPFVYFLILFLS